MVDINVLKDEIIQRLKPLSKQDHYMDTVSYILHQSLEKILKSISAYQNRLIQKTYNLVELYELLEERIDLI